MSLVGKLLVGVAAVLLTSGTVWLAYALWLERAVVTTNPIVQWFAPLITVGCMAIAALRIHRRSHGRSR